MQTAPTTPKRKAYRQTHINELLLTTAYRQHIRNEFLHNLRKDVSDMCGIADIIERERTKRIQLLNDETRAQINCANEYIERANEQFTSLAHTDTPTNAAVNIEEIAEATKEEFRKMFETYMKECHFDKLYVDDLIRSPPVYEIMHTEPIVDPPDDGAEVELLEKIHEKEKQIENEQIQHRARMIMMEREKEELELEIKILEDEVKQMRRCAYDDENEEKRQFRKEIDSLQKGLDKINAKIEKLHAP